MNFKEAVAKIKARCIAEGHPEKISEMIEKAHALLQTKKAASEPADVDLAYLTGTDRDDYIHDMKIAQRWAEHNRVVIAAQILTNMKWEMVELFSTVHNYLGEDNIIRKSAISAKSGEKVLIPLNMRDGSIIAIGKGNEDWNCSAPHGAGRLMSRSQAFKSLSMDAFKASMKGIYTTSVGEDTLDECADAYKPAQMIIDSIGDTVEVVKVIKPVYNFKASEKKEKVNE